jgi:hypothetical protein
MRIYAIIDGPDHVKCQGTVMNQTSKITLIIYAEQGNSSKAVRKYSIYEFDVCRW